MNQSQAYPDGRTYDQRVSTQYKPGDRVTVGPAYRMGGTYENDGIEGTYSVVSGPLASSGRGNDYKVARHVQGAWERLTVADYDFAVYSSRLSPA